VSKRGKLVKIHDDFVVCLSQMLRAENSSDTTMTDATVASNPTTLADPQLDMGSRGGSPGPPRVQGPLKDFHGTFKGSPTLACSRASSGEVTPLGNGVFVE
jgi:hypothetical protein